MAAERAVGVVILAVDVTGDRSADGHEPGAGRDGHEMAARQECRQEVVEAHACARRHRVLLAVDDDVGEVAVEADDVTTRVLSRVTVRSPQTARDAAACRQLLDVSGQVLLVGVDQLGNAAAGPSPPLQQRTSSHQVVSLPIAPRPHLTSRPP